MNKIMVRYKQLDFDRKDFETQMASIRSADELYRFKTIHQCDTLYTHVQISLCADDDDFPMMTVERVVPSHRFGEAVFNVVKNLLFCQGLNNFFRGE